MKKCFTRLLVFSFILSPTLVMAEDELTLEERISELEQQLAEMKEEEEEEEPAPIFAFANNTDSFFNPQIALFLDLKMEHYQIDPEDYTIPGFTIGNEGGLGSQGFSAAGTELNFNSTINDQFFGNVTLAMHDHGGESVGVDLEEAYVETTSLPYGFTVTGGRFFSDIGYLNNKHPHVWDFADAPLVYSAMLGQQLYDDGARLSWVAPTDLFIELGSEVFRGGSYPASGEADGGFGTKSLFINFGGDVGVSNSWLFGISQLWADAIDRQGNNAHNHDDGAHDHAIGYEDDHGDEVLPSEFTGDNDITIVDFVWKWAPNGNPDINNAIFQAEYFYGTQNGDISIFNEAHGHDHSSTLDGVQQGFYVQGLYQFIPRWRVGARYDLLWSDNTGSDEHVLEEAGLESDGFKPERWSGLVDYSYTENSIFRVQYNADRSTGELDNQVFFQVLMNFGAHGAHQY